MSVRLDADYRRRAWDRLAEPVDVLVVGGGVTGAGVALDAVLRGLSVILVEQRDFAAGTSSRSSKLIHGGLRYLEQRDFRLVREALHERALLIDKLAPHLVRPLPFLLPLHGHGWERTYIGAGLALYDGLAGTHPAVPRHSHLSKGAALRAAPSLRADQITGAIRYHDAQVDDARHTLEVVRTAAEHGATVLSGVTVVEFHRDPADPDRVVGARVRDAATGVETDVRSRVVVNATGPWAGRLEELAQVPSPVRVRTSKGVHVAVPRDRIASSTAIISRTPTSVLFILPWDSVWIIGTTDTAWSYDLAHPVASGADVQYLLDQTNKLMTCELSQADVVGVYAGLRPLVDQEGQSESELSREHLVRRSLPGFVTITGGKYTTYRVMADDAVDATMEDLGPLPPSTTASVPLIGAAPREEIMAAVNAHPAALLLDERKRGRLADRYGKLAVELLDAIEADPALAEPIPGGAGHLGAEVVHAATHEGALHVDDVLTRRTRLYLEAGDRGLAAAGKAANLMAGPLGWDKETTAAEVRRYQRRVAAELEAQESASDEEANATRERVRDPRLPDL